MKNYFGDLGNWFVYIKTDNQIIYRKYSQDYTTVVQLIQNCAPHYTSFYCGIYFDPMNIAEMFRTNLHIFLKDNIIEETAEEYQKLTDAFFRSLF